MRWHKFIHSDIFDGSLHHSNEIIVTDRVIIVTVYNSWTPDCCVRFEVLTTVLVNTQELGYDTL